MGSTRASISKVFKRPKINIIPPKQLFVDLTQDDTKTPSPKLPNSSPSAPNAPSKTPSTKDTSSSSIDYIPKSPTSSTSPSPNSYLSPSTSPPPRVSPPPPIQDNASMDITLTLSPNTLLDVQFNTPSPSPPIIAHPILWNFLEAYVIQAQFLKCKRRILPSSSEEVEERCSSLVLEEWSRAKRAHMANCNPTRTPVETESKLDFDEDPISDLTLYRSLIGGLQRSTSGYCIFLRDNLLSWSAKWQHTLSRLSVEAEYRGVVNVVAETTWLRNLLRELHTPLLSATLVYCDNVSAIYMTPNPVQHQRTKHIEIDIHFVYDMVAHGQVRVLYEPSRYQYDDIFNKGLPSSLLRNFVPV
ncbi:ribonuclease H-like domain-containing protein [Tanacetum coccineum]